MIAWVYILRCCGGAYYVGSYRGEDPSARAAQQNAGLDPKAWTYRRRPVTLVWGEAFERVEDAIAAERRIKGWTRAKKEALMAGDWTELRRLAAGRTPPPSTSSG